MSLLAGIPKERNSLLSGIPTWLKPNIDLERDIAIGETLLDLAGNTFFDIGAIGAEALQDPGLVVRGVQQALSGNDELVELFQARRAERRGRLPTFTPSKSTARVQQSALQKIVPTVKRLARAYPNEAQLASDLMNDPAIQTVGQMMETFGLPVLRTARGIQKGIQADLARPRTLGDELGGLLISETRPGADVAMTGWHGSPHLFSDFDMKKMGTGEGAQAFGWGVYIAEKPGTAEYYLPKGKEVVRLDGEDIDYSTFANDKTKSDALGLALDFDSIEDAVRTIKTKDYSNAPWLSSGKGYKDITPDIVETLESWVGRLEMKSGGHLYEVDIPDEKIARMLDWDKPLSEQPDNVKRALMSSDIDYEFPGFSEKPSWMDSGTWAKTKKTTAGDVYERMARDTDGGAEAVSSYLLSKGIPGIKYLDGTSRKAGEGTRNLVMFDPQDTRILSRNGEPLKQPPKNATVGEALPFQVRPTQQGTISRSQPRTNAWQKQQATAERIRGKRNKRSGVYLGAPKHIDTPQKKAGLVTAYANRIEKALDNGVNPGYFYAEGRQAIRDISEPGEGIITALGTGVTSTMTGPRGNMNNLTQGAEQLSMQGPESVATTLFPNASRAEVVATLSPDKETPWLGYKRERYSNLLVPEEDLPDYRPPGSMLAPNDRWEGRAVGFNGPPSGELQVSWNDEIRELALARVNKRRAAAGKDPLNIEQAQELHWAQIRADSEGRSPTIRPEDTIGGSLDRLVYQHSWESMPGKTSGHNPEVGKSVTPEQYHSEIKPLLIGPDGKDILVRGMGARYQRPAFDAPGEFEGQYSPSTQSQSLIAQTDSRGLLPQSRARVEGTEAVRSYILAQDADAGSVFSPMTNPSNKWNAVAYDTGATADQATLKAVNAAITKQFGAKAAEDIVVVPSAKGIKVFHPFAGKEFRDGMDLVDKNIGEITGTDGVKGLSQSHYNELGWKTGTATKDMLKILDNPDAPMLLKHADSKQIRQLMGAFADKYDQLLEAGMSPNQKLVDVLKTWRDQGLPGVRRMVKAGLAPALALTVLSQQPSEGS